eukprot:CAMPEP_0202817966 /NCGR_PEP_ID=MMETSP1389-20130828/7998_1 /ASSEMBLY_ACC=CAM_ASM_000865 /TAXON_ID=302021 /ORGANISM="Rhodomonas sp., Strain CCMP768" /LENGTH=263 /DNA_ID=CAMNT_0049490251 /DNA_START=21 /DNA_END=809 /DNA_ORIENTATION=+
MTSLAMEQFSTEMPTTNSLPVSSLRPRPRRLQKFHTFIVQSNLTTTRARAASGASPTEEIEPYESTSHTPIAGGISITSRSETNRLPTKKAVGGAPDLWQLDTSNGLGGSSPSSKAYESWAYRFSHYNKMQSSTKAISDSQTKLPQASSKTAEDLAGSQTEPSMRPHGVAQAAAVLRSTVAGSRPDVSGLASSGKDPVDSVAPAARLRTVMAGTGRALGRRASVEGRGLRSKVQGVMFALKLAGAGRESRRHAQRNCTFCITE